MNVTKKMRGVSRFRDENFLLFVFRGFPIFTFFILCSLEGDSWSRRIGSDHHWDVSFFGNLCENFSWGPPLFG